MLQVTRRWQSDCKIKPFRRAPSLTLSNRKLHSWVRSRFTTSADDSTGVSSVSKVQPTRGYVRRVRFRTFTGYSNVAWVTQECGAAPSPIPSSWRCCWCCIVGMSRLMRMGLGCDVS